MNRRNCIWIIALFILRLIDCDIRLNHDHYNKPNDILMNYMDAPREELFKMYHSVYKKSYHLNSMEAKERFKSFNENLKFINEVNSRNLTYKLGLGPFTDMSNAEFRQKILMKGNNILSMDNTLNFLYDNRTESDEQSYYPDLNPTKINWNTTMRPARDQGVCGCCWAFASVLAIEGNYFKKYDDILSLSVQQLVDCDYSNYACLGGWPSYAFEYMKRDGNAREFDYPYTSGYTNRQDECYHNKTASLQIVTGFEQCPLKQCQLSSWINLLSQGPITVAMDGGSSEFQNYKSGVLELNNCNPINHAVVAYGIDSDENGEFIFVRNSWSHWWGDSGDFKIRYNKATDTCGITSTAWLPQVQKVGPSPPPPSENCPIFYKECNYTGDNLQLCQSIADLSKNNFNEIISSIKLNTAKEVTLYEDFKCTGKSVTFTKDEKCIDTNACPVIKKMSKRANSLSVLNDLPPAGCIWVYQDCCYNTGKQEFCNDIDDLTNFNLNDKISSIKFGKDIKSVILYLDANYQGMAYGLNKDSACLLQNDSRIFYTEVSSIRIVK